MILPVFRALQIGRFLVRVGQDVNGCMLERRLLVSESGNGLGHITRLPPVSVPRQDQLEHRVGKIRYVPYTSSRIVPFVIQCLDSRDCIVGVVGMDRRQVQQR
jgi:hypothetical protein